MERKLAAMVVLSGFIGNPIKHKEPWEQPEIKQRLEEASALVLRITQKETA